MHNLFMQCQEVYTVHANQVLLFGPTSDQARIADLY